MRSDIKKRSSEKASAASASKPAYSSVKSPYPPRDKSVTPTVTSFYRGSRSAAGDLGRVQHDEYVS